MTKKHFIKNILILFFIIVINLKTVSYGNFYVAQIEDPLKNLNSWKPPMLGSETQLTNKAGDILSIINLIGVVSSVLILIIIGIKYMFGSIEEKAEYKNTIWMYILGAFMLFSATTIPNIIYKIVAG